MMGAAVARLSGAEEKKMTGRMIAHPSLADRRAHGLDARAKTPPSSSRRVGTGRGPPDPVALLEEQNADPGAGPGAGPARPDDGLTVHVLPWCGEDHGHRPGRHPDRRADRPALR